jgi:hypothetical protein
MRFKMLQSKIPIAMMAIKAQGTNPAAGGVFCSAIPGLQNSDSISGRHFRQINSRSNARSISAEV